MTERPGDDPAILLGEVHSGLLQNSTALPPSFCEQVLTLLPGERVRRFERPIAHVLSPDVLTGVDCVLATPSGGRARSVGTVACHASITGGHVLQASSTVRVSSSRTKGGGRRPWSHYLARPGHIEVINKAKPAELARAFIQPKPPAGALDLGAIGTRLVDSVQASPKLDRRSPMRAARTKLRWAALVVGPDEPESLNFSVESGVLRTVLINIHAGKLDAIVGFCEDLALHDWLLTTLLHLIDVSRIGIDSRAESAKRLGPVVDHLLHLWMPAARTHSSVADLWTSMERRPGLSRQWKASVDRVRDQLALSTVTLLAARSGEA